MKRSEAAEILGKIIFKHFNCNYECCENDKVMYLKILEEFQEKTKILPPETWRKREDHPDLCYAQFIELSSKVSKWED